MGHTRIPSWVWMVLGMVHVLAMAWALHSGRWDFPDSERYCQAAANLVQHGQLYARVWPADAPHGQAMQEFTIRPLGYPAILAALRGFAGSPWLILLVQNGLSLLTIRTVLKWWARQAQPLPRHWVGALILILTFPAQIIYPNAVMSEAFLQSLLLAMAAAILAFHRTGRLRYWAGIAGSVTLALLLKPICCLLVVGLGVAGLVLGWRKRQLALLVIGLLPMLVMGMYMAWNQQRTGYFHFSSIAEINLLHYNAAGVVRQVEGPATEDAWVAGVLRSANAQADFAARQRLIEARALDVLLAHPVVYARQHLLGMAAFFLDPGRFDVSEFLGLAPLVGGGLLAQVRAGGMWRAVGQLQLGLVAALLVVLLANITRLVLAVRGFWRLGRGAGAERAGRWVAVGLLAYLALLTGPLGAARVLMPAWPLLLGLALVGLRGPVESAVMPEATGANG
jgi:hypothetical protein